MIEKKEVVDTNFFIERIILLSRLSGAPYF